MSVRKACTLIGAWAAAWMGSAIPVNAGVGCTPQWHVAGGLPGVDGTVYDSVVFNNQLYISGQFLIAGGVKVGGVARWNGTNWEQVGGVFQDSLSLGSVRALAVYNNELYAGGRFTQVAGVPAKALVKWNGTEWTQVGAGLLGATWGSGAGSPPIVRDMVSHNGYLYIGGLFDFAGGSFCRSLAKWDGTTLNAGAAGKLLVPQSNVYVEVRTLASYNNELYVAGGFLEAPGIADTTNFAKWDGTNWSSAGEVNNGVTTMTVFDEDGAGANPAVLVVGGTLTKVGIGLGGSPGLDVSGIAKWNGTAWSTYGNGLRRSETEAADVMSLAVYDSGGGPRLYASVHQVDAPGSDGLVNCLMRWNGTAWEQPPGGVFLLLQDWLNNVGQSWGTVQTMVVADLDGAGGQAPKLIAGGFNFEQAGNAGVANIAAYNGTTWSALPEGNGIWISDAGSSNYGRLLRLAAGDEDGAGPMQPTVYAYGNFCVIGGKPVAGGVARKDGDTWTPMAPGLTMPTAAMVFFNDGTGVKPFAIGHYGTISKWNGTSWTTVGNIPSQVNRVSTAVVYDPPGALPAAIYIGGDFVTELPEGGTVNATSIVRFDGVSFTPVTSAAVPGALDPYAGYTLAVYNGHLYAGGMFYGQDMTTRFGIARYDGNAWTFVGITNLPVRALAVFQNKLYIGGEFSTIGGLTTNGIAAWDSGTSALTPVGGGVTASSFQVAYAYVHALTVGDDGTGEALFVGGHFETAGNVPNTRSAAKWNGSTYSPLGTGLLGARVVQGDSPFSGPSSMASIGNLIYFVGNFDRAGGQTSYNLAAWGCQTAPCPADFNGDSNRDVADLFAYINAWLAKTANADFNNSGGVDVADLFAYINAWLAGC